MTTPADVVLDALVAELSKATGQRWERWHDGGVIVTLTAKGRPWSFGHEVNLRKADANPAGYAAMVIERFKRNLGKATGTVVFDNEVAGYDEAWDLVSELPSLFFGGATIAELKHWVERMTAVLEKAQASQDTEI